MFEAFFGYLGASAIQALFVLLASYLLSWALKRWGKKPTWSHLTVYLTAWIGMAALGTLFGRAGPQLVLALAILVIVAAVIAGLLSLLRKNSPHADKPSDEDNTRT
jgi:thiol:disulfide interchange protein